MQLSGLSAQTGTRQPHIDKMCISTEILKMLAQLNMNEHEIFIMSILQFCVHVLMVASTGSGLICRTVLTDHGAFVLINVYLPNAGPSPARPRAAFKYRFLEALKAKVLQLRSQGREVQSYQR